MAYGLSSNPDKITTKDQQVLNGPQPDGSADGGSVSVPSEDTDTLGDLTPTKGTIAVGNGSIWTTLPVGNNDEVLIADSAEATGLRWGVVVVPVTPPAAAFDERDVWLFGIDDAENQDQDMRDLYIFGEN